MGISPLQLGVILVIVLLLFGTKKLRNIGSDLGGAIKGFKKSMKDEDQAQIEKKEATKEEGSVIDAEPEKNKDKDSV